MKNNEYVTKTTHSEFRSGGGAVTIILAEEATRATG